MFYHAANVNSKNKTPRGQKCQRSMERGHPCPHLSVRRAAVALLALCAIAHSVFAASTVTLSDTVVAQKSSMGINVSSASANIVNGGCFEAAPDSNGFASEGWGWWKAAGTFTASVDGSTHVSGTQSQKISVSAAPAVMEQTTVDLPQAALTRVLTPSGNYTIKAMLKSDGSNARAQLGIVDGGWAVHYSPVFTLTAAWAEYSWSYTSSTSDLWRGVAIQFLDNANYWVGNMTSWDANNIDPDTGFTKTYVDRLKEMKPAMLRLGGLGVNGLTLEHYLFHSWPLSYGPPPNEFLNINTFMTLCKVASASAFITVPPAFTDTASAATQTDLTVDLVDNHYADHGNLVDYLGGDSTTTYGARRTADGYARWDTQMPSIYYEMGNETWGTPDGKWDMHLGLPGDPWMQTYATYCFNRMTEMKGRTGWRTNMRVGFGGFAADTDSWAHYSTILIPAIKTLTDFGTIFMYYGSGSNTNTDEQIYGGLFAKAQWHQRTITNMNATYATAAGHAVECCIYEGNCVWGNYYNGPSANDMFDYSKEVSAGAAVSLLDNYAAGNHAGVTFNNHFALTGGSWSTLTAEPNYYRKPAYFALKMLNNYISGDMITATVSNAPAWNDTITGEQNVPYVACYPYKNGNNYSILLVNRNRTAAQTITIDRPLAVSQLVTLSAPDINANNEIGESVTMQVQSAPSSGSSYTVTVPPFSAYIVIAKDPGVTPTVAITSPANGSAFTAGANITISASASENGGTIAKVDFYSGTTLLGTATSGFSFTWNSVPAGSYALTAKATDSGGVSTTSSTVNITVNPSANKPPTVTITSPAAGATFTAGANITITASAADSDGTVTKVDFYSGTTLMGSATSGFTFTWNSVPAGSYALTAKATDNGGLSTTSNAVNIIVNPPVNVPPTVSITSPAFGATFTAGSNITITASAVDSDGTVAKVDFYAGTSLLGSAASGFTFTWNSVPVGSYALTAIATDNGGLSTTSSTVNITVNPPVNVPPTVSITSPAFGATFTAGSNITITASAADSDGTVAKVDFYSGTSLLGSAASGFTFTWNSVPVGSYALTAIATDNGGLSTTSSAINIAVNPLATPPAISSASSASPNPALPGETIVFSVAAGDADGDILAYAWDFGDGSTGVGASATHSYASTGNYTASVLVSDVSNYSVSSSINEVVAETLTVTKAQGTVKFNVTGHDTCTLAGALPGIQAGFNPAGQSLSVNFGGAQIGFMLNKNGRAKNGQCSFTLKMPHGKKKFSGGALSFTATLHGSFATAWESNGMDPNQSKTKITFQAIIALDGKTYTAPVTVKYTGKPRIGGKFTN